MILMAAELPFSAESEENIFNTAVNANAPVNA